MDLKILLFLQEYTKNNVFDFIMPIISYLSNDGMIWIMAAIVLLFIKRYRSYGYALSLGLILCLMLGNGLLKPLIARVRPYDAYNGINLLVNKLTDFSFPSGHTYTAFCGATVLYSVNKKVGYIAFSLASLTAFSRLYLFVHYPSDVLAGIFMGVTLALFSLYCIKIISHHFNTIKTNSVNPVQK